MKDLKNASLFAALAATLLMLPLVSRADVITIEPGTTEVNGQLDEGDEVAQDNTGSFYYDLFDFDALGTGPITITLLSDVFAPYLAWGFFDLPPWPTGSNAPYSDAVDAFCLAGPGSSFLRIENPEVGQNYQLIVATCNYIESEAPSVGSYTLGIRGNVADEPPVSVPEPGTLGLLGLGLAGLAFARRRKVAAA